MAGRPPQTVPLKVDAVGYDRYDISGVHRQSLVTSLSFSMDGLHLAGCCQSGMVRLYDVQSAMLRETLQAKDGARVPHVARFTHSSGLLCAALTCSNPSSPDVHVAFLSTHTGQVVHSVALAGSIGAMPPAVHAVCQSPTNDVVAVCNGGGRALELVHPLMKTVVARTAPGSFHSTCTTAAFSPSGNTLAIGDGMQLALYDWRMLLGGPLLVKDMTSTFTLGALSKKILASKSQSSSTSSFHLVELNYIVSVDFGARFVLVTTAQGHTVLLDGVSEDFPIVKDYYTDTLSMSFCPHTLISFPSSPSSTPHAPDTELLSTNIACCGSHFIDADETNEFPYFVQGSVKLPLTKHSCAPLLVFEGRQSLKFVLEPRDVGITRCIAVNPRFAVFASASRMLNWWGVPEKATS